jgi:hypothetical protein
MMTTDFVAIGGFVVLFVLLLLRVPIGAGDALVRALKPLRRERVARGHRATARALCDWSLLGLPPTPDGVSA